VSVGHRFGQNLVRARERAGLSQEALAFRASLHRTEIGHLERGQRLARIDTLVKLMAALGVTADELLDGIGWRLGSFRPGHFRDAGES
jgi:transcriptional regulator with XRE-family HTH domain